MIIRFAGLLLAALALAGCSSPSQTFEIDNPGDTPLTLRIDGNELPIAAHASRPVKLKPGAHHLHTPALGQVRFIVYARGQGGLINPTLSEYVITRARYVTDPDQRRAFGAAHNAIELGGVGFDGPYSKTHALFIDQIWAYGVREPFPDSHDEEATDSRINTKIFAAADFIAYVDQQSGQPGAYRRAQPAGYQAPVHALQAAPATLPPLDPVFERHAGPLRSLYARYLTATTADAQLQLQQEAYQAQMAFTAATDTLGADLPAAAHDAYSVFVTTRGELMGSAALVVP